MIDKKYKEIKDKVKEEVGTKIIFNKILWECQPLNSIKDKKSKKEFEDFVNVIKKDAVSKTFDACLNVFKRDFIEIENIPSSEDILGILDDRIKSNKSMIEFCKKSLVKHIKEKDKEKGYDKIKDIESEIFWDTHSIDGYKDEIYKYEHLRDCIKNDIRSKSIKIKESKE